MILSNPTKFCLFVACLALADGRAADVDLEKAVGSLITAEKAYAKLAGEKGFREVSISVFADDAVIFAPYAVNGKKFWRGSEEPSPLFFRQRPQDQIAEPIGMRDALAIGLQRFHRRIHAQVAV